MPVDCRSSRDGGFGTGVWKSTDNGKAWLRIPGYNFKWGHRPVFDPHNEGMLYLTTFGGSVYYGPDVGVPGHKENFTDRSWQKWAGM